jgi:prolyl-tRNA editing enzyme YbaK/EbsC (Cys-tRNA(Pro) deacylase)
MTDETSDTTPLHRNVVKVIDAGRALGVEVVPRRCPQGAKTAQDAADAIGVDVGQIVKSLIFGVASGDPDGHLELVLAYVSGSNQLDEQKLAAAAGAEECARVDADTVRSTTGFPIGGVPPFGHDMPLRIFIDPDLLQYEEVWAAAGTWTDVFGIEPDRLADASGGVVIDLRRD